MSLAVKSAKAQAMGDPGLLGSIGKFIGGGLRTVGGIIGGPVGFGMRTIGGLVSPAPGVPAPTFRRPPETTPGGLAAFRGGGAFAGTAGRFAGTPTPTPIGATAGVGLACPQGMHPNKSDYHLRSGAFVPKGTRCVPSRRRNPANSRANDRAIGRIESAKKMAARLARITIRHECPKHKK